MVGFFASQQKLLKFLIIGISRFLTGFYVSGLEAIYKTQHLSLHIIRQLIQLLYNLLPY